MTDSKTTRRRKIHFAISLLVTLVFIVLLLSEEQRQSFWETIAGVDAAGVTCFLGLALMGDLLRAMRYRVLLEDILPPGKTPSFPRLLLVTIVRNALVDMFPARLGELWYIYFLNRCGVPVAAGISSFAFCIVLDIVVLIFLIGGFLLMSLLVPAIAPEGFTTGSAGIAFAVVAVLCTALFVVLRYLPQLVRFAGKVIHHFTKSAGTGSLHDIALQTEESVAQISDDFERLAKRKVLMTLGWYTLLLRVCKYGCLYILLLAVVRQWGIGAGDIHPALTMIAFIVAEASASLPISGLMGFGAYESSWALVFSLSHVSVGSPLQVSLVVHLITQIKSYSLALGAMLCFSILEFRRKREE